MYKYTPLTLLWYFLAVCLLVFNNVFVYFYKLRPLVYSQVRSTNEILKLKWLSSVFLALISPLLIYLFNLSKSANVSEDGLFRFNSDWFSISFLIIGTIAMLALNNAVCQNKVEINTHIMKRQIPNTQVVGAVCIIALIFSGVGSSWIFDNGTLREEYAL